MKNENNTLYLFDAQASRYYKFERNVESIWQGKVGEFTETSAGYRWKYKDNIYVFNNKGLLIEYRENEYVWFRVEYNDAGHLVRIATYEGKDYSIDTHDDGRIMRIRYNQASGNRVYLSYSYKDGVLESVSDGVGAKKYNYNNDGLLTYASTENEPPIILNIRNLMVVRMCPGSSKVKNMKPIDTRCYLKVIMKNISQLMSRKVERMTSTGIVCEANLMRCI